MFMQRSGTTFVPPPAYRVPTAVLRQYADDYEPDMETGRRALDVTLLEDAVENNLDGVFVVDMKGSLVYINLSGSCQLELDTLQVQQQAVVWSALWCEDCADVAGYALESARSGRPCRFTARPGRRADRWLDVAVTPVLDRRGTPVQMLCIARDVTELKRRALESQQALLTEIDHRIKNSLTAVASLLSLQARRLEDDVARSSLQQARARIIAVAEVHRHLCESGRHESVDVGECIAAVATETVGALCGERNIRLELDCPRGVMLHADRATTLALITTELVTNCLKHAFVEAGGSIRIALRADETAVLLDVQDDGRGLPSGFDPGSSTCVGMKVVTTLLRHLDGTLQAEAVGRGALLRVVLPRNDEEARPLQLAGRS